MFGGVVVDFENRTSKMGKAFGKIVIEDYLGNLEIMLFGKDFVEYSKYMSKGLFILVRAKVQDRYNQPGSLELKINKIELLEEVKKTAFNTIKVKVKLNKLNDDLVIKLDQLANQNAGNSNIEFYIEDEEQKQNIKLFSKKNKIEINDAFILEMDKLVDLNYELA